MSDSSISVEAPEIVVPEGVRLEPERLLDLYWYMLLNRRLEERLVNLYRQGKVVGGVYRSLGQEAESVGTAYALDARDYVSPLIRNLGSILVKGAEPVDILKQYMAKGTGPSKGKDLNIHFGDLSKGFIGPVSMLGDMIPVMAGVALGNRMQGRDSVCLVYIGDGGFSTGAAHEGWNFICANRLPVILVAEDNSYAYSTPTDRQMGNRNMVERAAGYGCAGVQVDGNDVLQCWHAGSKAVFRARSGGGPTLIEVKTYRRKGHAEHDDQRYVPAGELESWEAKDPVARYERWLLSEEIVDREQLDQIDGRVRSKLDAAVDEAERAPMPEPRTALDGVWSTPRWTAEHPNFHDFTAEIGS
ncbi:MAG TPA: thiamine pyrophosphate-dependent dehydrogenase E1 component subunit alpha [Gemmatimonadota bacterium]|jgi:pyruvate dehydrogenase E1 component alpha subunit/2-oxoisovalerate dehydrogenase E1 component alpha subunit|nr:thiamine pyrophosphate-dependent dehydrogenase E1 component subunit alpha [Gemmatimonadota bacterium]